jgi:uncharacterized protein (DUF1330 family)
MSKGYWIATITINDPSGYPAYIEAGSKAVAAYGGRFLVRGGESVQVEGPERSVRHAVLEFDTYEAALACYRSDEYQAAAAMRWAISDASIYVVRGLD